jgi:Zn-dependent protease
MPNIRQGAIHLTRVAGIDLYLHWSWFIVAAIEIAARAGRYSSLLWNILEYLTLFGIVLLHEFGHALACRQVGGTADRIMLWPLGGVAFVNPPPRPGATLWSLAAGPLVNVALLLPLGALGGRYLLAEIMGQPGPQSDIATWLASVLWINIGLLLFNILPIYPLDGGQILRSLLWFVLGRARSLAVATALGFVGAAGLVVLALLQHSTWTLLIAGYMLMNCWSGLKSARAMLRAEKRPRREGFACPSCGAKPPLGAYWKCARCSQVFDTFATGAVCPHCGAQFPNTLCGECHRPHPMSEWSASAYAQQIAPGGRISG